MSNAMPVAAEHIEKYIKLGRNIAHYRKQRGYTQVELAQIIGISRSHLSAIEAPNVLRPFSIELLFSCADALRVTPAKLMAL